ncbi:MULTISPECIES: phage tail protein [Paenibacillus]|uniref:Phage tail protein n=1 Tax=Paenibacillus campinasensis TaxID=66347 RepID=A0A268ESK9_9BACL|nr:MULTISPECIES: tail fiber protein [Paenibacillus]MUG68730.1 phage tail protein [Paenibacillus campinasensis]PAD76118.1 phage tail protein [Paenibacillus campinasensis]PAK54875.1 phage tail protein [Paenibacillus sp. 7541]
MDQYIGEIRMFAGDFAPVGWELCDGRLLHIQDYELLFSLLGTTYGGDGLTTFGLPDLRGRVPIHYGTSSAGTHYALGQKGGSEVASLTVNHLPPHTHIVNAASTPGTEASPTGHVWAAGIPQYAQGEVSGTMVQGALESAGGNQPHNNMMPTLAVHFMIATEGIYP